MQDDRMKLLICATLLALAMPAIAVSAPADNVNGSWAIDGNIEDHPFKVYCTLEQDGILVTGVCHDDGPTGKARRITSGTVSGDQVSFSFKRNYLLLKVTAGFKGTLTGSTITGKATAVGFSGPFTAVRQ
jgi:hypothetical protein